MENTENFEKIYAEYWEKLNAFSFKITQDQHLAQNVVQDVFIDLWERRKKIDISSVENYLFRAVKNQIFKNYRDEKFDKTVLEDHFEHYLIDNFSGFDTEISDKLHILLNSLPEKRREIILMHKIQEMNIDEIALELSISKQTVKNQISMGLKQLRIGLKNLDWMLILLLFLSMFL